MAAEHSCIRKEIPTMSQKWTKGRRLSAIHAGVICFVTTEEDPIGDKISYQKQKTLQLYHVN